MAKIDVTYDILLQNILKNGFRYEDENRKGVYRLQIPSYEIRHNLQHSFPAITTKKLYWKGVVGELLWFLRGSSDIRELWKDNIHIWDKDFFTWCDWWLKEGNGTKEDLLAGKAKDYMYDMGRIYGVQWRKWTAQMDIHKGDPDNAFTSIPTYKGYTQHYEDQFVNLINGLKEKPMGTSHIVNAWNPAETFDMALPPCHWSFEILVEPINMTEVCHGYKGPKYGFTLKWHQRSVDTFLGLPFNIASYALLAEIIGSMANMTPLAIIGDLSNVHIYEDHLDAVKQQMKNDMYKHGDCQVAITADKSFEARDPNLNISKFIEGLSIKNFTLWQYDSYPSITAEMLARDVSS